MVKTLILLFPSSVLTDFDCFPILLEKNLPQSNVLMKEQILSNTVVTSSQWLIIRNPGLYFPLPNICYLLVGIPVVELIFIFCSQFGYYITFPQQVILISSSAAGTVPDTREKPQTRRLFSSQWRPLCVCGPGIEADVRWGGEGPEAGL